jgi:CBS domain-containing membrane protein
VRPSLLFSVAHCGLSVAFLGLLSMALGLPLMIPAVGASSYIVFAFPQAEVSAPRNVLIGHLVGAAVGWILLRAFGLEGAPVGLAQDLTWTRIGAVAASLAATVGILRLADSPHPPAGATTMIVSVGMLPQARHVLGFGIAAAVVVVHAVLACRAAGIAYPRWSPFRAPVG